jgi:hypothetical protein
MAQGTGHQNIKIELQIIEKSRMPDLKFACLLFIFNPALFGDHKVIDGDIHKLLDMRSC